MMTFSRRKTIGIATAVAAAVVGITISAQTWTSSARDLDSAAKEAAVGASTGLPTSPFQDQLLADGRLTEEEYDSALEHYRTCTTDAGGQFIPDPPARNSRGTWTFTVTVPPVANGARNDEAITAVRACEKEYFDVVQSRWTAEHLPLHSEVEAAKASIVQCMRERGIEMPDGLPVGWGQAYFGKPAPVGLRTDREAGQAFADCSRAAGEQLGYGPGGGLVP